MADSKDVLAVDAAGRAADRMAGILHHEMKRGTATLQGIALVAPLLGAFGTVVGLIETFNYYPMWASDRFDTAGGPAETLILVMLSLPVAVFACIGFCFVRNQMEIFDFEMRTATLELLNDLARLRGGLGF